MKFTLVRKKMKGDVYYVYIGTSYRDPATGKPTWAYWEKFGKEAELLEADPCALEKIQAQVDALNARKDEEEIQEKMRKIMEAKDQTLKKINKEDLSIVEGIEKNSKKIIGILAIDKVYNLFGLDSFIYELCTKNHFKKNKITRIINHCKFLSEMRALIPASKQKTQIQRDMYFGDFSDILLHKIYRTLSELSEFKQEIVGHINKKLNLLIDNRDLTACFYDVTTYFFESTEEDEIRRFGFSKDNKINNVQVVMSLVIDRESMPIDYNVYIGNQSEGATLIPEIEKLKQKYNITKVVVVADRGLNNKVNTETLLRMGMDFVFAFKAKGTTKELKEKILNVDEKKSFIFYDENGNEKEVSTETAWYADFYYQDSGRCRLPEFAPEVYSYKNIEYEELNEILQFQNEFSSKYFAKEKETKEKNGRKNIYFDCNGTKRMIVTWSAKRARKDKKDRDRLVEKAKLLVANPSRLNCELKRGGKSFIKFHSDDKKSAELDIEKIKEQEKFDGYHVLITSLDQRSASAQDIIDAYSHLWTIEQSFRHLKTDLETRPIFVRRESRIRGHFVICYIALCIIRYIEYKLKKLNKPKGSETIINALNDVQISRIKHKKSYIISTFDFSEDCEDIFDALDIKHLSQTESAVGLRLKYGIDDLAPYWAKYDDKPRHRMVMPKGQGDQM